jgi:hypothetical protein
MWGFIGDRGQPVNTGVSRTTAVTTYHFGIRAAADVLAGVSAAGGFILASKSNEFGANRLLILTCTLLLLVAAVAGFCEPSLKRVWIHALLIMSPELVALPVVSLACPGFECAGAIAFLMLASLFAVGLIPVSFLGFALRAKLV